jgi:hypothetical protein
MKLVFICSPFAGDIEGNTIKAEIYSEFACRLKSAAGIAPHLLFPRFLDELVPEDRKLGMCMALEILSRCDELWVFGSLITAGMGGEIEYAKKHNIKTVFFDENLKERGTND